MNNSEYSAYEHLSDSINNFGFDKEKFVKEFLVDHRYLQQQVFNLALAIVASCADDSYRYDDRNEYAHTVAKKIKSLYPELESFKIS